MIMNITPSSSRQWLLLRWRGSKPKYATLTWGLFWAEGNWESTHVGRILCLPPMYLKTGYKFPFVKMSIPHPSSSHPQDKKPAHHQRLMFLLLLLSREVMSDSFAPPWTVVCQAPVSMGFPRQEYCSGLPFPSPGDRPKLGIKPTSLALAGAFFTTKSPGMRWRPRTDPQTS